METLSWGWVSRNALNILTGDSNDHLLNYAITIWVKHIVIFLQVNIHFVLASAIKVSRIALNIWPYEVLMIFLIMRPSFGLSWWHQGHFDACEFSRKYVGLPTTAPGNMTHRLGSHLPPTLELIHGNVFFTRNENEPGKKIFIRLERWWSMSQLTVKNLPKAGFVSPLLAFRQCRGWGVAISLIDQPLKRLRLIQSIRQITSTIKHRTDSVQNWQLWKISLKTVQEIY